MTWLREMFTASMKDVLVTDSVKHAEKNNGDIVASDMRFKVSHLELVISITSRNWHTTDSWTKVPL